MTDLKTVTFDASQWQIVPKVPTDEMLDAASHASMQHLLDCINDPVKARELGSEENARKTHASRYQSMLAAAPTPAAQSAGQEAVAWFTDDHLVDKSATTFDKATAERWEAKGWPVTPLYAAPVNGGERELGQVIDERDQYHDAAEKLADAIAKHFGVEIGEHSNLNCPWQNALDHIAQATKRAADAPQVANESDDLFNHWYETKFRPAMERGPFDKYVARQAWFAALTSPTKVGGDGLIEQHARDSAELRRLCAARDEARRTAEYWKANHIAGNAEIERLRKLLEVKVGGDERDAFEWPPFPELPRQWASATCPVYTSAQMQTYAKTYGDAVRAALSADGGEDKRDAERYRIVRLIPTLVMHYGLLEGGSGLDARCDAAIAANQSGKGGE